MLVPFLLLDDRCSHGLLGLIVGLLQLDWLAGCNSNGLANLESLLVFTLYFLVFDFL